MFWCMFYGLLKRIQFCCLVKGFYEYNLDPVVWWCCWVLYPCLFSASFSISCSEKILTSQLYLWISVFFFIYWFMYVVSLCLVHTFRVTVSSWADWLFNILYFYIMFLSASGNYFCSDPILPYIYIINPAFLWLLHDIYLFPSFLSTCLCCRIWKWCFQHHLVGFVFLWTLNFCYNSCI